jgi:hypothetical protein
MEAFWSPIGGDGDPAAASQQHVLCSLRLTEVGRHTPGRHQAPAPSSRPGKGELLRQPQLLIRDQRCGALH